MYPEPSFNTGNQANPDPEPGFLTKDQAKHFYSLGRELAKSLDEEQQFKTILERLRIASSATVGALMVVEEEEERFIFRASFGLNCSEAAIRNLAWSAAKKKRDTSEDLHFPFSINSEEMNRKTAFAFEQLLGFKSLCFQPLMVNRQILGAALLGNRHSSVDFQPHDLRRLVTASQAAGSELERIHLYRELKNLFINSVRAFVSAIDAKDPYTHGHSERVTDYSIKIARTLGWSEELLDALYMSAILHDIGKIGIPETILSKPGRLTSEEYALIKRHPEIGAKIVGEIPQLRHTLTGILYHHERFDGQGYPQRLAGKDIPPLGRLIAVADAYDAMTSDRPYRKGLQVDQALEELFVNCRKQFDPEMVSAFMSTFQRGAIQ